MNYSASEVTHCLIRTMGVQNKGYRTTEPNHIDLSKLLVGKKWTYCWCFIKFAGRKRLMTPGSPSNSCHVTGGKKNRKVLDFIFSSHSLMQANFPLSLCAHCGSETLPFPDNAIKSRVLHVTSPLLSTETNKSPHICHNKGAITLKAVSACVWILIQSSCSIRPVRWKCTPGIDTTASLGIELCTAVHEQGWTSNNGRWNFCRLHHYISICVQVYSVHYNSHKMPV